MLRRRLSHDPGSPAGAPAPPWPRPPSTLLVLKTASRSSSFWRAGVLDGVGEGDPGERRMGAGAPGPAAAPPPPRETETATSSSSSSVLRLLPLATQVGTTLLAASEGTVHGEKLEAARRQKDERDVRRCPGPCSVPICSEPLVWRRRTARFVKKPGRRRPQHQGPHWKAWCCTGGGAPGGCPPTARSASSSRSAPALPPDPGPPPPPAPAPHPGPRGRAAAGAPAAGGNESPGR